jgi:hypothetical protein
VAEDSLPDESLFLISSDDIWYRDIIIYLQTQTLWPDLSSIDHRRICYQADNTSFAVIPFITMIFTPFSRQCLTYDEAEKSLNDCHSRACGSHMYGYAIAQKIL